MIINATRHEIYLALAEANKSFGGNLTFNNFVPLNKAGTRHRITLRVLSSKGPGHRLSYPRYNLFEAIDAMRSGRPAQPQGKQRRLVSACWHAHGAFFDALPPDTQMFVRHLGWFRSGDPWQDIKVGSMMFPSSLSELCECP